MTPQEMGYEILEALDSGEDVELWSVLASFSFEEWEKAAMKLAELNERG